MRIFDIFDEYLPCPVMMVCLSFGCHHGKSIRASRLDGLVSSISIDK